MNHPAIVRHEDFQPSGAIAFGAVHLAALGAFFTGVNPIDIWICLALYFTRIWGVTAGFHRYFSHKTYKTSRVFQFILAFWAQTSAQKSVLWWAANHRRHHKYSDTIYDIHSPKQHGFWFAHVGWIFTKANNSDDFDREAIPDLLAYPELVWLHKYKYLPATVLATAVWLFAGWSGLFMGFFVSTILTYHGTFLINSLMHVIGKARYVTTDESKNSMALALLTLGEGWHNNHHYYQSCARQGFMWWEIDITYYTIKILEKLGIVWDVLEPSKAVVEGNRRLPKPIADRSKEIYAALQQALEGFAGKGREVLDTAGSRWDHFTELGKESVRLALIDLSHRFDDVSESVAAKVEPVREKAREALAHASEAAEHTADLAREKLHHAAEAVEITAERARQAFAEAAEALDPAKPAYSLD